MKKTTIILGAFLVFGLAGCQTTCEPNDPDCIGQGRGNTDPTITSSAECDPSQPDCDGHGRGNTDPT